jgi:hypothetical protein
VSTNEDVTGYENIEIISPYEIQQVSDLKITRRINSHTTIRYTGIVPEAKKDQYIQKATAQDGLEINCKDDSGGAMPLFKGLVSKVGIKTALGVYYLEVEGFSYTAKLDVKLQSRSFQDKEMKFGDLFTEVIKAYPGGDINDYATKDAVLEKLIIQHNETDWSFLKRMASRFNTVLIPYDMADQPKLWLGLPDGGAGAKTLEDDLPYRIGKNLVKYSDLFENYLPSVTDTDFVYFIVETNQYYPLGSRVKFKEVELFVAQSTAMMKKGVLRYESLLCLEYGLKQKPMVNREILGAAMEGKVIDVDKDRVRVQLEIDPKQDREKAWWFPYATFYTAEGNSGFYCMPEQGDYVRVYFPTGWEETAVAVNSVRKDNEGPKTQDPEVKYWGTNHDKELMMSAKELTLTAKNQEEGEFRIKLNDDEGIEIRSDREIHLKARKNLTFDLGKKAAIKAKNELQLICGSSSIDLDGTTHFKGPVVDVKPG